MKKFLALLVALVLCLSSVAFAESYAPQMITEPAWEGDVIDADIVVYQRSSQGVADDIWWWDFCREYFKIDFTVTQTTSASDYKSIAFMGGSMPDVFYQLFMSTSQQVEMGYTNMLLLDLAPYITEEIMPNLSAIFAETPSYRSTLEFVDEAGQAYIFGLGAFNNANDSSMKFFINNRWLQDAGLEVPTTLDEFETALAAFKARGEDVVPIGGDYGNGPRFLASALGWNCNSANYLTAIALRDGAPEFIYGNKEMFPIFMEYMKKWVDAGYFSKNLFSSQVSGDEATALKAQDLIGFEQNTNNVLNTADWVAAKFLTSEWNEAPQVGRTYNAQNNQSFSLAADVEESKIERLMKWCDWHYDYENYQVSHNGPSAADTEWLLGLKSGWTATKNEEDRWVLSVAEIEDGTYGSMGDYQNQRVQGIIGGYLGLGVAPADTTWPVNPTKYNYKEDEHILPYIEDAYPQIVFLSAAETEKTSALSAPINNWVNEQYAAFVSGMQEINEENLENFYAKLEGLGFAEYQQIYIDYYNNNVRK